MFLVYTGNLLIYSGVNQGDLALMKLIPFLRSGISFLGSKRRYRPTSPLFLDFKLVVCVNNITL